MLSRSQNSTPRFNHRQRMPWWVIASSTAFVLLFPWSCIIYIFMSGVPRPLFLLDEPPSTWLFSLVYLAIVLIVMGLLLKVTRWESDRQSLFLFLCSGFAILSCILVTSGGGILTKDLLKTLNAQESHSLSVQQVVVLAQYSITERHRRGGSSTHDWIDISHPLLPDRKLSFLASKIPQELRVVGTVACVNIYMGKLGWRWTTVPKRCPKLLGASRAPPNLTVLRPVLRDQVFDEKPFFSAPAYGLDGAFDGEGKAWWLINNFPKSRLVPAGDKSQNTNADRCQLNGMENVWIDYQSLLDGMGSRWSGDYRSLLTVVNLVFDPPNWDRWGRNVWIYDWSNDGQCTLIGSVLQSGRVLDADFNHNTRQLAVLSTARGGHDLSYLVAIYSADTQGKMQIQSLHQLAKSPWDFKLYGVSLKWEGKTVVLQDQLTQDRRVTVPQEGNAQVPPEAHASAPTHSVSVPDLLGLSGADWYRVAQAKAAPIALYSHPRFNGDLLHNSKTSVWYYLPTTVEILNPKTEFGLKQTDLIHLSADGRKLMVCTERGIAFDLKRCTLWELPWPQSVNEAKTR